MTDPDFADRTYVEPLDRRRAGRHHRAGAARRRCCPPSAARPRSTWPWPWSSGACSTRYGVELIGANAEAIATAEDRERFKAAMTEIGLAVPASGFAHALDEAAGRRRARSAPGHRPARATSSAARAPASPPTRDELVPAGRRGPRRQSRSARSSSSGRSPAGRSTSSR